MRKTYIFIFLVIILLSLTTIEAKQGCCSKHGGVCGNKCCDGTALSEKCKPSAPTTNVKKVVPIKNVSLEKNTSVNLSISLEANISTNFTIEPKTQNNQSVPVKLSLFARFKLLFSKG